MGNLMEDEHTTLTLEVWKKTIEVQQHFNDLELRIRNYAVTVLVAVVGAAGLIAGKSTTFSVFGFTTSSTALLFGAGLVAWLAFYMLDRWWYHRLLQGAVQHGEAIEAELQKRIPNIALTGAISKTSRFKLFGRWTVRASHRIDFFYGLVALLFVLIIVGLRS